MDDFLEKLKDFLYDATDYIIMLAVVGVVAGIIGWRLDILFAEDTFESQHQENQVETSNIEEDNESEEETKDNKENDDIIKVSIPEGSLSGTIADILMDNDLIDDKTDFLKTAEDLDLEKKLKPGEFEIEQGSTYEEILRIISK